MGSSTLHTVIDRLSAVTTICATRNEMDAVLADVKTLRSFADSVEASVLVRLSELAAEGYSETPIELLRDGGHRSSAEARAAASRAGVCSDMPAFHDALSQGAISSGHVDAVARATARLDDAAKAAFRDRVDELVEAAASASVDEFAKHCRDTAREASSDDGLSEQERQRQQRSVSRFTDKETGMAITRLALDPATDEQLWSTITTVIRSRAASGDDDGRSWEHVAVDTIVDLVTGRRTTPGSGSASGVFVVCDWAALQADAVASGIICETVDGHALPVSTVRRLCCDANIIPVVLGGEGEVLDVGRAMRLASPAQRRALSVMYTHCSFPGCNVTFRNCDIHHVNDWMFCQGATDLDNLTPLCDEHHHLVHEGHWRYELHPDRTITITRPDGHLHYHGTSLNRRRKPAA